MDVNDRGALREELRAIDPDLPLFGIRTMDEALAAAQALLPPEEIERQERKILSSSDSQTLKEALSAADNVGWMNRNLYAGLVPHYGSSAITLVGTPEALARAFVDYKEIGVTQFIIAGWPKLEEMMIFGREVLPLVRKMETVVPAKALKRKEEPQRET